MNQAFAQILAGRRTSGSARGVCGRGRPRHQKGRMNKTEARYADYLEQLRISGLIQWWGFEVHKIRLADGTFYEPDFSVVSQDGSMEEHEVKAYWKKLDGPAWEDDARVKVKVAAEHWPAVFKGVHQRPDGEWRMEIF